MGIAVLLCLAPSAAAVTVAALRCRPRTLPAPYVAYRPDRHPAVIQAEAGLRQTYADLAPLYDAPTLPGPPAR